MLFPLPWGCRAEDEHANNYDTLQGEERQAGPDKMQRAGARRKESSCLSDRPTQKPLERQLRCKEKTTGLGIASPRLPLVCKAWPPSLPDESVAFGKALLGRALSTALGKWQAVLRILPLDGVCVPSVCPSDKGSLPHQIQGSWRATVVSHYAERRGSPQGGAVPSPSDRELPEGRVWAPAAFFSEPHARAPLPRACTCARAHTHAHTSSTGLYLQGALCTGPQAVQEWHLGFLPPSQLQIWGSPGVGVFENGEVDQVSGDCEGGGRKGP